MATYEFICEDRDGCGAFTYKEPFEVWRPMRESKEPAFCPMCGNTLERIYGRAQISVPSYPAGYNPGLGKVIKNKREHEDRIREIKDTTGKKLVEVGNEKPKEKTKRTPYTITRDEIQRIYNRGGQ